MTSRALEQASKSDGLAKLYETNTRLYETLTRLLFLTHAQLHYCTRYRNYLTAAAFVISSIYLSEYRLTIR